MRTTLLSALVAGGIFTLFFTASADDTAGSGAAADIMDMSDMSLGLSGLTLGNAPADSAAGVLDSIAIARADSLLQVRRAATFAKAVADYDSINAMRSNGVSDAVYFPTLYSFVDSSFAALDILEKGTPEYTRVKSMIRRVHPYLVDGAIYYSGRNDSEHLYAYAHRYVDIKLNDIFADEALPVRPDIYPQLVYIAAADAIKQKDYESAIRFFKEYFTTGCTDKRDQVYLFLGQSALNTGNYLLGVTSMRDGLREFSTDFRFVEIGAKAAIDGGLAEFLPEFVDKALALQPDNLKFLEIRGKLLEDLGDWQGALNVFNQIDMLHPDNLAVNKHIALCYYNMASTYSNMAVAADDEKNEKKFRRQAKNYFSDASTKLSQVTASDPTAVKYLKALAVSYLFLDNKPMFQEVNTRLQALGEDPLEEMYMPPTFSFSDKGGANFQQTGNALASSDEIPSYTQFAKPYIEDHLAEWSVKGEFEKMEDYTKRVNDDTMIEQYNLLSAQAADEYLKQYSDKLRINNLRIQPYDANNEVYRIDSPYGPILLKVPLKDNEAELFRVTWNNTRFRSPRFYIKDDRAQLASITFVTPANKVYTFNVKDELAYSNPKVEIDYIAIMEKAKAAGNHASGYDASGNSGDTYRITAQSDVDTDIPNTGKNAPNTLAVIIANERYQNVGNVASAINDGETFAKYCTNTLGIPKQNVRLYTNATFGTILRAMADLQNTAKALGPQTDVIFYYAGHGMPDESSKESFLIPVDGDATISASCYPLAKLYKELGDLGVQSVSVFLDACFSGARRDGGMLMAARGVVILPKQTAPEGNMFVLSAASGQETALPYTEKNHGMFTYYLLKKLQDTKGNVTLKELADYVTENVRRQSNLINKKPQNPTVTTSGNMRELYTKKKLRP